MMSAFFFFIAQAALHAQNPADTNPYDEIGVDAAGGVISSPGWTRWDPEVRHEHLKFFYTCVSTGEAVRKISSGASECLPLPGGLPPMPADFKFDNVTAGTHPSRDQLRRLATPQPGGGTAPCPASNMGCRYARAILDYRNYCYEVGYRPPDTAHCPNDYGDLNRSLCDGMTGVTEGSACTPYVTGGGFLSAVGAVWHWLTSPTTASSTDASGSTPDTGEARDDRPRRVPSADLPAQHNDDEGSTAGD